MRAADHALPDRLSGNIPNGGRNVLVETTSPADLVAKLKLVLPAEGQGQDGLLALIQRILQYSVNTWDQGFLDKLYASNTPVSSFHPSPTLIIGMFVLTCKTGWRHI